MEGNGAEAADGSLSNDEYRKIHHRIRAGIVIDAVITESPAILTYLASLAPARHLLGKDALAQAK
ncbi:glutathione s-transferase [Metarhizium brunneum]